MKDRDGWGWKLAVVVMVPLIWACKWIGYVAHQAWAGIYCGWVLAAKHQDWAVASYEERHSGQDPQAEGPSK